MAWLRARIAAFPADAFETVATHRSRPVEIAALRNDAAGEIDITEMRETNVVLAATALLRLERHVTPADDT